MNRYRHYTETRERLPADAAHARPVFTSAWFETRTIDLQNQRNRLYLWIIDADDLPTLNSSAKNWKLPSVILYTFGCCANSSSPNWGVFFFLFLQRWNHQDRISFAAERNKLPIIPSINLAYSLMPRFRVGLKTFKLTLSLHLRGGNWSPGSV